MQSLGSMQAAIVEIYAEKMKQRSDLEFKTNEVDEFGREIKILQPTVIIIDSISQVLTDTFSVDNQKDVSDAKELRGNSEGARDAKSIKGFFKDIIPLCKEANIIIYAVNHINSNMKMNAFTGPTKQQIYMKADEAIPGGLNLIYSSFSIIKLSAKTSDDFTDTTDGFSGHMIMFEPVKSSSNQSGNNNKGVSFEMVFSFKNGFDSLRSLVLYGREKGIIDGNKPRLKFVDDPSFTFSFKDIDKEKNEKPIWESIYKYILPELKTHLSFVEPESIQFDERSLAY
jgi:hypothetical protein